MPQSFRFKADMSVQGTRQSVEWEATYSERGLVSLTVKLPHNNLAEEANSATPTDSTRPADARLDRLKDALTRRLAGERADLDWEAFDLQARAPFHVKIWRAMREIPFGSVATYGDVAEAAGSPLAFRACGQACNGNPILLFIPCHRVVGAEGLGGFGYGLELKTALLALEGFQMPGNRQEWRNIKRGK